MTTPLYSIIESITNPEGRFKTLQGIYPCRDSEGELELSVATFMVNIKVIWNGKLHLLKCFITDNQELKDAARRISRYCDAVPCDYLTSFNFLEGEMLVFDQRGESKYLDVILQQYPEGGNIEDILNEMCDKSLGGSSKTDFSELFGAILRMSQWCERHKFTHRNIKPTNVVITSNFSPVLVNYENVRISDENSASAEADSYAIATLTLMVYMAACEPRIYKTAKRYYGNVFRNFRKILPELCQAAYDTGNEALQALALAMLRGKNRFANRTLLNNALDSLGRDGIGNNKLPLTISGIINDNSSFGSSVIDIMSKYDRFGALSQGLRRVKKGKKWFFTDPAGNRAIEEDFDYAEDFCAGRAIIGNCNRFGVIDPKGKCVLPVSYDDIRWYPEYNAIIAEADGHLSLFDRDGLRLSLHEYDWLGDIEEGLIAACTEGKYGYLYPNGGVALAFTYDNAYDFRSGRAITEIDGEEWYIDKTGAVLGKVSSPDFLHYK